MIFASILIYILPKDYINLFFSSLLSAKKHFFHHSFNKNWDNYIEHGFLASNSLHALEFTCFEAEIINQNYNSILLCPKYFPPYKKTRNRTDASRQKVDFLYFSISATQKWLVKKVYDELRVWTFAQKPRIARMVLIELKLLKVLFLKSSWLTHWNTPPTPIFVFFLTISTILRIAASCKCFINNHLPYCIFSAFHCLSI